MLNEATNIAAWVAVNPGIRTSKNGNNWGKKLLYISLSMCAVEVMVRLNTPPRLRGSVVSLINSPCAEVLPAAQKKPAG